MNKPQIMPKFHHYLKIITPLLFLFSAKISWAAGLVPCSGPNCQICHILVLISNIALFLVKNVMPSLAGLLFLVGGIMMIAAAGSEERYKKGRQVVINTAIGAAIVLVSWLIVNSLITTIGQAANVPGFNVENWWRPNCN